MWEDVMVGQILDTEINNKQFYDIFPCDSIEKDAISHTLNMEGLVCFVELALEYRVSS